MKLDKKVLMSLFIAGVMVISVLGFALTFGTGGGGEKLTYGEHKFTRLQQGFQTKIEGKKTQFAFFPDQLTNIGLDERAGFFLNTAVMLWFTYDPESINKNEISESLYYMEQQLTEIKDVYVQRGLTDNANFTLPKITCANATQTVPVLLMQRGNETAIRTEDNCIIATANSAYNFYRLADRMLYSAFGVMK